MICVVVPFRDRGEPVRKANLERVLQQWHGFGMATEVVDDGAESGPFNLFAAYNRGAEASRADVLVYALPDYLISVRQIRKAITIAAARPGLVIPFRQHRALPEMQSRNVRRHLTEPVDCVAEPVGMCATAVNVVSKASLDAVGGWDETFSSPRYGGRAMQRAFEICCGPTRWVDGETYQLYRGCGDAAAGSDKDSRRLDCYAQAATGDRVRELTAGGW